jgi:putative ATP-dependent endonuclease of OLD family
MRLIGVSLENFRCYQERIHIPLGDFAALIGKNDAGKSTILEALAIFFGVQKADRDDASKHGDRAQMVIACHFDELPEQLVLDATFKTSFAAEHLLNAGGVLEIEQVFDGTLKTPSKKVFLRANYPSVSGADDLLTLTRANLSKRAKELGVDLTEVNESINAELRAAVRGHFDELELEERLIPVSAEGAKEVYSKIQQELPSYFLFSADRPSTDQDAEAQDPMRAAVELAIASQKDELERVAESVVSQLRMLIERTLEKITAMSPSIAAGLTPRIGEDLKWESVFKVSLHGESEIPLNKRGSGIRRMVLLGFLQAQAEVKSAGAHVIYAIEEPETGQHPDQQRALLNAVRDIAEREGSQVIMTTHTPTLGRLIPEEALRYVHVSETGDRKVLPGGEETFEAVSQALGILPDHRVKVFVGVEGKHDMSFLTILSKTLSTTDSSISDFGMLETNGSLIFVPAGGSNVALWVSRLRQLAIPEFHLFDRDLQPPANPKYKKVEDQHNEIEGVQAVHTNRRELENYLHVDAIRGARPDYAFTEVGLWESVPLMCARAIHSADQTSGDWGDLEKDKTKSKSNSAKSWLNTDAAAQMTSAMLDEMDPADELRGWLRQITLLARR